jgi:hypothetical protein
MHETFTSGLTRFAATVLLALTTLAVHAENSTDTSNEIEFLLHAIGSSNCSFERNGTAHSAPQAEEHLRMKYNKARKHVATADEFIDKLASESSWTGKPYFIKCQDTEEPSRNWLSTKLTELRSSS